MVTRTRVRATNWPTRAKAKETMPRQSRKGENVASRRTYESRRTKAVAGKLDELLANAQRKFARIATEHATVATLNAIDRSREKIADALAAHAVDLLKRNA